MREGALVSWLVEEGAVLSLGDDVAEVETEKINGIVEAPEAGLLRRRVAQVGDMVPVGGLLGVLADASVSDDEIDAFVADFAATFVPEDELDDEGPLLETLTVGGTSVSYSRHGGGTETLVLLHGFGGDMTTWLFNHEALSSADRTVIAPDLPGHGSSSKEVAVGDLAELTGAVSALLDGLGAERVDLASHSLGGAVASAVALQQPGRVRSLTLVASAGLGPEVNADFVDGFVEAEGRRDLKPVLELLFADPELVTRQLVQDVLKYKRLDGVQGALRAIASQVFPEGRQGEDLAPRLRELEIPILVLWGSDDQVIPASHADSLAGRAQVEVLTGQGHAPQLEAASEAFPTAVANCSTAATRILHCSIAGLAMLSTP